MSSNITIAGENLIAQKHGEQKGLEVSRFVFALIPGLNPDSEVDRASVLPPAAQIVHTATVQRSGYVTPNQVVYSVMLGSDVGDWNFNWVGLQTAENVLLAVAYVPVQEKRKSRPPYQVGNNLTRNFMVAFSGAMAMTGITIDASTWQHDFTVRLGGIDERERLTNRDLFGRSCFFGSGLQLVKTGNSYQLKPGIAYVEGIRVVQPEPTIINVANVPSKAWLEVALQRKGSDMVTTCQVVFGANLVDKTDSAGARHYFVPIADLPNSNTVTDLRPFQPVDVALIEHLALRNGDYEQLRARGTKKEDVGLSELPNAKSDDPKTNSSDILATTKALNALRKIVDDSLTGLVGSFAMAAAPPGWLKANGAAVSRTTYAGLFQVIGTRFGVGDGVNTFNLPDPRGLFTRAWSDGSSMDAGRGLGTVQEDAGKSHTHTGSASAGGSHIHPASTDVQGSHSHEMKKSSGSNNTPGGWVSPANIGNSMASTEPAGAHSHTVTVAPAGEHGHIITIGATGGGETRPWNIAFLACIKY
ncbi:phage tail protein [Pseudomonas fragi]|nr:phage tail protein [Pseudomonas fragi]